VLIEKNMWNKLNSTYASRSASDKQIFPLLVCLPYSKKNAIDLFHPDEDSLRIGSMGFPSLSSTSVPCFLRYITAVLSSSVSSTQLMPLLRCALWEISPRVLELRWQIHILSFLAARASPRKFLSWRSSCDPWNQIPVNVWGSSDVLL
jgi:hypothetical protein